MARSEHIVHLFLQAAHGVCRTRASPRVIMNETSKPQPSASAAFTTTENVLKIARIYGGMPLLLTLPGSPAEQAGLRWGDIVIAVNGIPTPDAGAFVAARKVREGAATVRYVRDGREREVELVW